MVEVGTDANCITERARREMLQEADGQQNLLPDQHPVVLEQVSIAVRPSTVEKILTPPLPVQTIKTPHSMCFSAARQARCVRADRSQISSERGDHAEWEVSQKPATKPFSTAKRGCVSKLCCDVGRYKQSKAWQRAEPCASSGFRGFHAFWKP